MPRFMKRAVLAVIVIVVLGAVAGAAFGGGPSNSVVRIETVEQRDLVASVTASGQISPETSVDIASDVTGRIIEIPVEEGQTVERNQLLLRIDPTQFEAQVARAEASLSSTRAQAVQARVNRDQAKRALDRAMEMRRTDVNLVSDEQLELTQQSYDVAVANFEAQEFQVAQAEATLSEANEQLSKTVLRAPMAGKITRLAVEEGEIALASTFSRETGLLMTIADLSVILINVRVDETDVIRLALHDSAEITIDAFPDTAFVGRVTQIAQSAIQIPAGGSGDRAVDYDVEIMLTNPPTEIRPDLSGTAKIITDTREQSLSIPIIALTVREHRAFGSETGTTDGDSTLVDTEGVFVVENGAAHFRPVQVGIAGEEHFEVLTGLNAGDSIVAGPYQTIRDLQDSSLVTADESDTGPREVSRAPRTTSRPPTESTVAAEPVAPAPPEQAEAVVVASDAAPDSFAVQVAAFQSPDAADQWVAHMAEAGHRAVVVADSGPLYKVQVGSFTTLEEGERFARELRWDLGGLPFVVARS